VVGDILRDVKEFVVVVAAAAYLQLFNSRNHSESAGPTVEGMINQQTIFVPAYVPVSQTVSRSD